MQDKISMSTQNSMRAAHDTISIAMAAKDALVQQRSMLSKVRMVRPCIALYQCTALLRSCSTAGVARNY